MGWLMKLRLWQIAHYQYSGQLDKAVAKLDRLIEKHEHDRSLALYADLLKRRGFIYYLKGDNEKFLQNLSVALDIAKKNKFHAEEANCRGVLGIYYQQTEKNLEKALNFYDRAISIKWRLFDFIGLEKLAINKATLLKEMNNYDEAIRLLTQVLQTTKDKRLKINCNLELGRLYLQKKDLSEARDYLLEAIRLVKNTQFVNEKGDCYRELGHLHFQQGDFVSSNENYTKAFQFYSQYGFKEKSHQMLQCIYNCQENENKDA